MPLSDEQIDKQWRGVDYTIPYQQFRIDVARAIESAATAPLLTQIAALEVQLAEARKDAERLDWMIFHSAKVQVEYYALRKEAPTIAFLQAECLTPPPKVTK